MEPMLNQ